MSQYEMSAITAVTLVIYGFVMRHERMKRILAKQNAQTLGPSAAPRRASTQGPWMDSLFPLKVALASLQMPRRKLR